MTIRTFECGLCELERVLVARAKDLRVELVELDPHRDGRYGRLFDELVAVDLDLRMLKGRMRGDHADA